MSNLTRWEPFREMNAMRSMMERMFGEDAFGPRTAWLDQSNWDLALDVAESGDAFVVKASLPGMNPDDLNVTYNNNLLTIQGEVKEEHESNDRRYHLRERRYGSFSRSISLPSTVNANAIDATYHDGVLTLTLPKIEEAKPRKITVQGSPERRSLPQMIEGRAKDVKSKK